MDVTGGGFACGSQRVPAPDSGEARRTDRLLREAVGPGRRRQPARRPRPEPELGAGRDRCQPAPWGGLARGHVPRRRRCHGDGRWLEPRAASAPVADVRAARGAVPPEHPTVGRFRPARGEEVAVPTFAVLPVAAAAPDHAAVALVTQRHWHLVLGHPLRREEAPRAQRLLWDRRPLLLLHEGVDEARRVGATLRIGASCGCVGVHVRLRLYWCQLRLRLEPINLDGDRLRGRFAALP